MDIKHNTKPVLPRLASQRIQKRHLSLFSDPPLTNDEWKLHHTWVRHLPDPKRFIKVLAGLWPIVAWSILTSVAAGLYYELAQEKHGWPVAVSQLYVEPFVLTSFAVSLLLVFRTNSSYDRWWEARKDFGRMYNCARNLARMVRYSGLMNSK